MLIWSLRELALAEVLPELVVAELSDEVEVEQAVAVHVGHGEAVAVVVVDHLVLAPAVVHGFVAEGDAALGQAVGELEVVEDGELPRRGELGRLAGGQGGDARVGIGVVEVPSRLGLARLRGGRGLHLSMVHPVVHSGAVPSEGRGGQEAGPGEGADGADKEEESRQAWCSHGVPFRIGGIVASRPSSPRPSSPGLPPPSPGEEGEVCLKFVRKGLLEPPLSRRLGGRPGERGLGE
jgi:hypothetical protein